MNPPTQPTQLKPGDIRQAGDLIRKYVFETRKAVHGNNWTQTTTTCEWCEPRLIAPHTIGRVILPADLMHATFFRP